MGGHELVMCKEVSWEEVVEVMKCLKRGKQQESGSHTLYPGQQGSLTEPTVIARITLYLRDSRQM